jgi:hypothetical protein
MEWPAWREFLHLLGFSVNPFDGWNAFFRAHIADRPSSEASTERFGGGFEDGNLQASLGRGSGPVIKSRPGDTR